MSLYDELMDNLNNYDVNNSTLIFFPDSKIKVAWDLIGMIFIIYQAIFVPIRICFDLPAVGSQAVFELLQDFYFLVDIFVSFNTAYYEKGNLIMQRMKIIINYFKLWFWLDMAASFPYSLLVNSTDYFDLQVSEVSTDKAPQILRLLKFMKFMRFLRIIRVIKLKKILIRVNHFFIL